MTDETVPAAVQTIWPNLHHAVHRANGSGELGELRELLESGADVGALADTHAATGSTVLHQAATGPVAVMNLLLEHGADRLLEATCGPGEDGRWSGFTALQIAVRNQANPDVAQCLIDRGAIYDVFSAASLGDVGHLKRLLDEEGSLVNAHDAYHATPLHAAARMDQVDTMNLLIRRGADVDAEDDFGETPLLTAAMLGKRRAAERLLAEGAAVDLLVAAALGDGARIESLIREDASQVTRGNRHGTTALHAAALSGQIEAADILLANGADLDAVDRIGCTPLWYAAYWGEQEEMTRLLCRQGAAIALENVWGKQLDDYDCGACFPIVASYR